MTYSDYLSGRVGGKVQKLTINAGFTCPNRDGSLGRGGCTYCNNQSFVPGFTREAPSVAEQIARGKQFFARKYPTMKYLAYFQAYTNTYGPQQRLLALYREALEQEGVVGLIIGTRPDCVSPQLLVALQQLSAHTYVMIEYGAESSHDATLERVNRCHTWAQTVEAVERTARAGIDVGLHLIMGLPGETRADMLATIDAVNRLPIATVKIHQLQVLRHTVLAREVEQGRASLTLTALDDYLDLCVEISRRLRPDIIVERWVSQAPPEMVIAPRWGVKNYQFVELLRRRLQQK